MLQMAGSDGIPDSTMEVRMAGTILLIILILLLVGAVPTWPHSADWGWGPGGALGVVVVVLLILVLMGRL